MNIAEQAFNWLAAIGGVVFVAAVLVWGLERLTRNE